MNKIITKGKIMLKYMIIFVFIGVSFLGAENINNIDKLEAEKYALQLKLEAYTLKKKIIELEKFIEEDKMKKEEKIEREHALIRLKNDLRANRHNSLRFQDSYAG